MHEPTLLQRNFPPTEEREESPLSPAGTMIARTLGGGVNDVCVGTQVCSFDSLAIGCSEGLKEPFLLSDTKDAAILPSPHAMKHSARTYYCDTVVAQHPLDVCNVTMADCERKEVATPFNNCHRKKNERPCGKSPDNYTDIDSRSCFSGREKEGVCRDDFNSCVVVVPKVQATSRSSFTSFRINYLIVIIAIMLADGLQGTHLYVLYEGYGFSVASLYCLGFLTGAVASPITGPLVDRFGRKKSAVAYCLLEIAINQLEQYPYLPGLIISRMVGGITTNLLSTVFETWLDTEYRRRGFKKCDYEILMRDSVVVSNLAAICSGYLAHLLADHLGPKGPFKGAVTCTCIALGVVMMVWSENYGSEEPSTKSASRFLNDAFNTFRSDSRVLRVGLIHGLTTGAIQIFIFLWSPSLRTFAKNAPLDVVGVDKNGEPAYGLIFGAFMACGVIGGVAAPYLRKAVTALLSPLSNLQGDSIKVEGEGEVKPMAVEFLAAWCYIACSLLLLTPCVVSTDSSSSFTICFVAFLLYEILIGVYLPTAGVIRSIYFPSDSRCSILTMPQVLVNVAVSVGVASTNFITLQTAFTAVSFLMMAAAILQLTLVPAKEWSSFFVRVDRVQKLARRLSFNTCDKLRRSSSLIAEYGSCRKSTPMLEKALLEEPSLRRSRSVTTVKGELLIGFDVQRRSCSPPSVRRCSDASTSTSASDASTVSSTASEDNGDIWQQNAT